MFKEYNDEELFNIWKSNPLQEKTWEEFKKEAYGRIKKQERDPKALKQEAEEARKQVYANFGKEVGE